MAYQPTDWENLPSEDTPVIAEALDNMESGIKLSDTVLGVQDYDNTATYAVGAFCIHNNTLYKCTTEISTAESWTAAHWQATTVNDELLNLQNVATTTAKGLMSSSDKAKLNNILLKNANNATINANNVPDGIQIVNGWSTTTLTNFPSNIGWGILIQNSSNNNAVKVQTFLNTRGTNGSIWTRYYDTDGGTWSVWKSTTETVTDYEITSQAAHSAGTNSYQLRKCGKVVTLTINPFFLNSITKDTWTELGTIPSAVRPSKEYSVNGTVLNNSTSAVIGSGRVVIRTAGTIGIKSDVTLNSMAFVSFSASWILD